VQKGSSNRIEQTEQNREYNTNRTAHTLKGRHDISDRRVKARQHRQTGHNRNGSKYRPARIRKYRQESSYRTVSQYRLDRSERTVQIGVNSLDRTHRTVQTGRDREQ